MRRVRAAYAIISFAFITGASRKAAISRDFSRTKRKKIIKKKKMKKYEIFRRTVHTPTRSRLGNKLLRAPLLNGLIAHEFRAQLARLLYDNNMTFRSGALSTKANYKAGLWDGVNLDARGREWVNSPPH